MTYGIKRYGTWRTQYWIASDGKNSREIFYKNNVEYTDLDTTLFQTVLKEELDVPDYAITEKNIMKEFGYEKNNLEIKPECMKRIVEYYKWRSALFRKICEQMLDNKADALLKQVGSDEIKFKYYIPAEYNNFSCEDPSYTGGQTEAYLEITLYK